MNFFNSKLSSIKIEDGGEESGANFDSLNKDLNKGLTVLYQEGTQNVVHKENPDYYHTQVAAKRSADTYLRSLKDGETPHEDAQRLFGIYKNKSGNWTYSSKLSAVANVHTLGDYMALPLQSKSFANNATTFPGIGGRSLRFLDPRHREKGQSGDKRRNLGEETDPDSKYLSLPAGHMTRSPSSVFDNVNPESSEIGPGASNTSDRAVNLTLGDGLRQPNRIIGPDDEGNYGRNKDGELVGKRAGEYYDKKGNKFIANPLKSMGQAQMETENDYARLINGGVTDIGEYFKAAKKNSHRQHGRKASDRDPVPEGSENPTWHSLKAGSKPMFLHTQIDSTVHNMANYHDIMSSGLPDIETTDKNTGETRTYKDVDSAKKLLEKAKTSSFVKCNCPSCVLNESAHPENQYWDMQDHNEAALGGKSHDERIKRAYFAGFPVGKSSELGKLSDLGKVAVRGHHRIFWGTDSAKRYINHVVQFNNDEKNHVGFVKPKVFSLPLGRGKKKVEYDTDILDDPAFDTDFTFHTKADKEAEE